VNDQLVRKELFSHTGSEREKEKGSGRGREGQGASGVEDLKRCTKEEGEMGRESG
jgi:hypothetical protein